MIRAIVIAALVMLWFPMPFARRGRAEINTLGPLGAVEVGVSHRPGGWGLMSVHSWDPVGLALTALASMALVVANSRDEARATVLDPDYCSRCRYPRRGTVGETCPECGTAWNAAAIPRRQTLRVASKSALGTVAMASCIVAYAFMYLNRHSLLLRVFGM